MVEKVVVVMKLKVDLNCSKCYKKVKKALRKFPHELYDEKSNSIIIYVVCYDPERLMNKLCDKGDGSIKSVVIHEPPKPPQPQAQLPLNPKQLAPAPTPAPAPAAAPALAPTHIWAPQPMPMWQPYQCGPYYEAQQYQCYGRPVYESWGGGRQCCHEDTNSQVCSII